MITLGVRGGGGGGGIVFASGREVKIFSTVFQDFGKNIVGKWYFQPQMVPINKKSGFGDLSKKSSFLISTLVRFSEHLENFS